MKLTYRVSEEHLVRRGERIFYHRKLVPIPRRDVSDVETVRRCAKDGTLTIGVSKEAAALFPFGAEVEVTLEPKVRVAV